MPLTSSLDLTFLDSGFNQHVFVLTELGRLVLADTRSIVSEFEFEFAHRALSEAALSAREKLVFRILRESGNADAVEIAREYFLFVRSDINQANLTQLWRSAVDVA